jgi:hypothetical protein
MRALRSHIGLAWPSLGLIGSLLVAISATRLLAQRPLRWWWQLSFPGGHGVQWHLFWAGVVLLCVAWLGLGRRLRRQPGARPAELVLVAAVWLLPLALGPALFSLDMYSYLAQGAVLAHGLNPYHTAPQALHDPRLLAGVSPTWRHTTTPYGPLFVGIASLAARLAGPHIALGITLLRLPELIGVGLLAWFVPRLARALGADPVRATWLAVLSPLTLLYLVGGGHNDALMAGLMVAGVTLAVERRPLAGIALCALAATVKLPAAAAVGMIGICWLRAEPRHWRWIVGAGVLTVGVVALLVGAVTGVGASWLSGGLFTTPATARMALTPSTAVSVSLWELTHHFGAGVEQAAAGWENVATLAGFALVGAVAVALCLRVRYRTLVRCSGWALIAAALGGPAAWPWYLSWGVVLLAADARVQRSRWLPALLVVCALPVMAGGQVAIALPHALRVVAAYAAVLAIAALAPLLRRLRASRTSLVPGVGDAACVHATVRMPRQHASAPSMAHVPPCDPSPIVSSEVGG